MADGQLRDRSGGGSRSVGDFDPLFFCVGLVDVVNSNTAADYQLELSGFSRGVNDVLFHFCGRTNDHDIDIFHGSL